MKGNARLITPGFEIAANHLVSFSQEESYRDELDIGGSSAMPMAANTE